MGHVSSICIECILIDPSYVLSIMPHRLVQFLQIRISQLAMTMTIIYGFNATKSQLIGKIYIKCQLGDLKTKATCHMINVELYYNILLGHSWVHGNLIDPSSLHLCFKHIYG